MILQSLKNLKKPIKIANIGMGAMGKGILYQLINTPNIDCIAVSDINLQKAVDCAEEFKINYTIVSNQNELEDAVKLGKLAISDDSDLISKCDCIDALIESSNSILPALQYSKNAILNGKDLILMNSEVDLAFGPYLNEIAINNDVVFTSCDGDQHTVLKRMINQIELWGLEIVMAGNIKGFLDRYSNPTVIIPEADKRNLDYKMATAYTDGTKLSIEMALLANSCGYSALKPGMNGPNAKNVHEVFNLFNFEEIYSSKIPCVDYICGAEPGGGVFVIAHQDNNYQTFMMNYYKMGTGPFYLFYRPYHLCHLEIAECIYETVIERSALLKPDKGFKTNVFTYAKKDLKAGEILDGIGGYNCYGMIDNCENHDLTDGIPVCIAENLVLSSDVVKDQKISFDDVIIRENETSYMYYLESLKSSLKCQK